MRFLPVLIAIIVSVTLFSCGDDSANLPEKKSNVKEPEAPKPIVITDTNGTHISEPIPLLSTSQERLKFSGEESFVYEENGEGYHGYFEMITSYLNKSKLDRLEPALTLGNETWTFCKIYTDIEIARVEFKVGDVLHRREFMFKDNELIHISEKEIKMAADDNYILWDARYVLENYEVILYSYEAVDKSRIISKRWFNDILKTWESHSPNYLYVKNHLGYDGVFDIAALNIQTGYLLGENDGFYYKYLDSDVPVKIVTSHYIEPDRYWQDTVFCYSKDETVRNIINSNDQRRNRAWLISSSHNHSRFKYLSKKKRFYISDLFFTDSLKLKEVRIIDKQWKGRWSEVSQK